MLRAAFLLEGLHGSGAFVKGFIERSRVSLAVSCSSQLSGLRERPLTAT